MASPEKLTKLALQGDNRAAAKLIELFYKRIFAYLARLTANTQDTEDLTQQTFAKLWSSLSAFKKQCSFATWIHKIAYNVYVDWLRAKKNTISKSNEWWHDLHCDNSTPLKIIDDRQTSQLVYRAVDQLDYDKKQMIHLHYYQGLSLRQTAFIMQKPISTTKYQLRQALKQLKLLLVNINDKNDSHFEKRAQNV